jgi:hypothetical protein
MQQRPDVRFLQAQCLSFAVAIVCQDMNKSTHEHILKASTENGPDRRIKYPHRKEPNRTHTRPSY